MLKITHVTWIWIFFSQYISERISVSRDSSLVFVCFFGNRRARCSAQSFARLPREVTAMTLYSRLSLWAGVPLPCFGNSFRASARRLESFIVVLEKHVGRCTFRVTRKSRVKRLNITLYEEFMRCESTKIKYEKAPKDAIDEWSTLGNSDFIVKIEG